MRGLVVGLIVILILAGIGYSFKTQITGMFYSILGKAGVSTVSMGDILKNPQNYVNKEVTLSGIYDETIGGGDAFLTDEQGYEIKIINCEESGRTLYFMEKYKATGIITYTEKCNCEWRDVVNITEGDLEQLRLIYPQLTKEDITPLNPNPNFLLFPSPEEGWNPAVKIDVSACLEKAVAFKNENFWTPINSTHRRLFYTDIIEEGRCQPNSTEKDYYFKCTEPMQKI